MSVKLENRLAICVYIVYNAQNLCLSERT